MKKVIPLFMLFVISIFSYPARALPASRKDMGNFSQTQIGIASYYGGRFHGRRTAIGEWYDQTKLTAAFIPLPCKNVSGIFSTYVFVDGNFYETKASLWSKSRQKNRVRIR